MESTAEHSEEPLKTSGRCKKWHLIGACYGSVAFTYIITFNFHKAIIMLVILFPLFSEKAEAQRVHQSQDLET